MGKSRSSRARSSAKMDSRNVSLPGLARTTPTGRAERNETNEMELLIAIIADPTPEQRSKFDPSTSSTWRALSTVLHFAQKPSGSWAGIAGLRENARRLGSVVSAHWLRQGLRELVDSGCINCVPDPSLGERLPD